MSNHCLYPHVHPRSLSGVHRRDPACRASARFKCKIGEIILRDFIVPPKVSSAGNNQLHPGMAHSGWPRQL